MGIIDKGIIGHSPPQNLIALVGDGASVVDGQNNSVLTNLKAMGSDIFYLHCIAHCIHLVASKAAEKIPRFVFKFIKSVYKHFCKSPKRIAEFEEIMEKMKVKIKKILKAGKTRWLSLQASIKRIIELWDPLAEYFDTIKNQKFIQDFANQELKVYLQFLAVFLEKINQLNIYFQKEASEILNARNEMFRVYSSLSNYIFKSSIIIEDQEVVLDSQKKFNLQLEQDLTNCLLSPRELYEHFMNLFAGVIELDLVSEAKRENICQTFQLFLLEVLKKMKYYLPFDNMILSKIKTLDPQCSTKDDWMALAKCFKNVIKPEQISQFYDEVSAFMDEIDELKVDRSRFISPKKYFEAIQFYKDASISLRFPLMTKLSIALLSLPHSSAAIERVFSQLKLIKNERRSCLHDDTLESLLICKINGIDVENFKQSTKISDTGEKSAKLKRKSSSFSPKTDTDMSKQMTNSLSENAMEILDGSETLRHGIETKISLQKKRVKIDDETRNDSIIEEQLVTINLTSKFNQASQVKFQKALID